MSLHIVDPNTQNKDSLPKKLNIEDFKPK